MKKYLLSILSALILSFNGIAQCPNTINPYVFAAQNGATCFGQMVMFDINYYGGGSAPTFKFYRQYPSYEMIPSDYNLFGGTNLMIMDPNIHSFTIEMTSNDPCASVAKVTYTVSINKLPIISINNESSKTVCATDGFQLITTPNKSSQYAKYMFPGLAYSNFRWYKDNSLIPGATDSIYTPTTSGQYYMQYFYSTNTNGSTCNTFNYNVTVVDCTPFSTSITGSGSISPGQQNVVYSVANQTGFTYTWSITGGTIVNGQHTNSVTVDWDASTSHSISIVETNQSNQPKTTTTTINTITTPTAQCPLDAPTINDGDQKVCSPSSYTFHSTAISNVTYQWKLNGTNISGATLSEYTAVASGSYSVVISNGVCDPAESMPAVLTVIERPLANAGPDQYVLKNTLVTLNPSGGTLYSWSPADGLSDPNTQNPTITISQTTTFMVTVSDATNTCNTQDAVVVYVTNATSVSKSLAQSGITLFPNPATESFNIEMPESGVAVSYEILDLTGASVAKGNFVSTNTAEQITTNFGAGMYQVVLRYKDVVTCGRLSKVQ